MRTTFGREQIRQRTSQLQADLWAAVRGPATDQPTPVTALVLAGMNDVINSQGYTQAAFWNRIPIAAWLLMAAIALCANVLFGFRSRMGPRKLAFVLPFVISIAWLLIADIDAPRHGLIRVRPQNLESSGEVVWALNLVARQGSVALPRRRVLRSNRVRAACAATISRAATATAAGGGGGGGGGTSFSCVLALMSAPLHLFQSDRHVELLCARVNLADKAAAPVDAQGQNGRNTVHHVVGRSVTGLPDAPGESGRVLESPEVQEPGASVTGSPDRPQVVDGSTCSATRSVGGRSAAHYKTKHAMQLETRHAFVHGAAIGSRPAITLMDSYASSDNDERQQLAFSVC